MAIQKTPPPGWPHTEAAKYYDQESKKILQKATPPETKKRSGCCGGTLVTFLILLAIAGIIVAVVLGFLTEEEGGDIEAASDAYMAAYPQWTIESADYPDSSGAVRLVTWDYDRSVGRIVFMEPDEYFEGGWVEQPLLPPEADWSEQQFYDAFSDAYSGVHWTYAVMVEPSLEGTSPADHILTYRVWEETSEQWTDLQYAPAILDPSEGWLFPQAGTAIEETAPAESS
jgi:hypothetical protein